MKMKKACEATALTERAIRLYISKGLIVPRQKEGLIDFSPEDIRLLQDIALLRQMDFSIEQIAGMIGDAQDIPAIVAARLDASRAGVEHEQEVLALLTALEMERCTSLHGMADSIRTSRVIPTLNFAQFDEITDEERLLESMTASHEVDKQQRRQNHLHHLGWTVFVIVVVLAAAQFFLSRTRIEGYISVSPITVVEVQGSYATFRTSNEQMASLLGRDTITVPYRVDGFNTDTYDVWGRPALMVGETIDHACLLKVRLTWYDLLRLGINPLQDFDPPSVQRHNEWMAFILRAVLEDGRADDCVLWLREYPATRPLLWVAE